MNPLLETAYWPNLHYFYYILNSRQPVIELYESYSKQSFRNRTQILAANGKLDLTLPIQSSGNNSLTKNIQLSYAENWQIKHWRSITSAYGNSPFFEFFEEEIAYFYEQPFGFLVDYNTEQLKLILKLLKIKKELKFTSVFEKEPDGLLDLRGKIHPKVDFKKDTTVSELLQKPYYQTFEDKFPFQANLSILDLLFNKGLQSVDYLMR